MSEKPARAPRWKRAISERVESAPVLTEEQVNEQYDGEWVLVLLPPEDRHRDFVRGRVLEHSRSRSQITRTAVRVRELFPEAVLYRFMAGPQLSPEEFRRRVLEHDFPEDVLRAWGW